MTQYLDTGRVIDQCTVEEDNGSNCDHVNQLLSDLRVEKQIVYITNITPLHHFDESFIEFRSI